MTGTIHLRKILHFEFSANMYLLLIRKLKTHIRKTIIMIESDRALDCLPQKIILDILRIREN